MKAGFPGARGWDLEETDTEENCKVSAIQAEKNLTCLIFMCTPHPKIPTHQEDGLSFISVVWFTKTIGIYFHFEDKKSKC